MDGTDALQYFIKHRTLPPEAIAKAFTSFLRGETSSLFGITPGTRNTVLLDERNKALIRLVNAVKEMEGCSIRMATFIAHEYLTGHEDADDPDLINLAIDAKFLMTVTPAEETLRKL